jgi:hypothetical protein
MSEMHMFQVVGKKLSMYKIVQSHPKIKFWSIVFVQALGVYNKLRFL